MQHYLKHIIYTTFSTSIKHSDKVVVVHNRYANMLPKLVFTLLFYIFGLMVIHGKHHLTSGKNYQRHIRFAS